MSSKFQEHSPNYPESKGKLSWKLSCCIEKSISQTPSSITREITRYKNQASIKVIRIVNRMISTFRFAIIQGCRKGVKKLIKHPSNFACLPNVFKKLLKLTTQLSLQVSCLI